MQRDSAQKRLEIMDSSTPNPKPPRRPPPVFNPGAEIDADRAARAAERDNAPASAHDPKAPVKIKPYHGSCPKCEHGTMFPLARFYETDVNENPTADAVMPTRTGAMFFPGLSLVIMMVSWIANLTWDKGRVERGRARVRKARAEVCRIIRRR